MVTTVAFYGQSLDRLWTLWTKATHVMPGLMSWPVTLLGPGPGQLHILETVLTPACLDT